ncbi:MAG: peptidylprolyl isomerase [Bacteroidota bacterium]
MKRWIPLFALLLLGLAACGDKEPVVTIHTSFGDMKVVLFNQTPQHKESFLRLADAGEYDSTIFHRVINNFMIQGGDIARVKSDAPDIEIPFEYVPEFYHKKGALAGARIGERGNPARNSGAQWYIVLGQSYPEEDAIRANERMQVQSLNILLGMLFQKTEYQDLQRKLQDLQAGLSSEEFRDRMFTDPELVAAIEKEFGKAVPKVDYTEEQLATYAEVGGTPHLDGGYTVFGQVIEGLDVIDKIAAVETHRQAQYPKITPDQPKEDIKIWMTVELMSLKDIEKEYGYIFPMTGEEEVVQ